MRRPHVALSVLARRALPQYSPHKSRNRFHGRLHRPLHLRRHGRASAHPAPRIYPRSVYQIQNHLHGARPHDSEKSRTRPAPKIRGIAVRQTQNPKRADRNESRIDAPPPPSENQPRVAATGTPSFRRPAARPICRWRLHRARNAAIFLRFGNSSSQWLRLHRSRHDDHSERSKAVSFRHRWQAAPWDGSKNREPRRRRNRRSHRAQPHTHVPLSRRSRNDR